MSVEPKPGEKVYLFTTKHFLAFGVLVYFITAISLTGILSDTLSFLVALPIAVAAVGIALRIKRSSRGMLFLTALVVAEIIFMVFAGIFWTGYRNHAWLRKPVAEVQEPQPPTTSPSLYDFAAIPENYETADAAVHTWAKYTHGSDVTGVWRSYSQHLRDTAWNNDFSAFQREYSKSLVEQGTPSKVVRSIAVQEAHGTTTKVVGFKVLDEHRVVNGQHAYKYTIDYLQTAQVEEGPFSSELLLVQEGNQWKVDGPSSLVFW